MTQNCTKHGQRRIYDEDDEISKNAIVLTANEPKLGGEIMEIPQIATQISALLYPMREIDEISIMANFSNF